MIRFHNRVVDALPASVLPAQRFNEARKKVTKHYQWDDPTAISSPGSATRPWSMTSSTTAGRPSRWGRARTALPTMPIEFSVAAYRLGHSTYFRAQQQAGT